MQEKEKKPLTNSEASILKEKFLKEYSEKKGWDKNDLTFSQIFEIINHPEYKNLIKG